MDSLIPRLLAIRERIDKAAKNCGRSGQEVTLELAVKTRTPHECANAAQALEQLGRPVLLGHNRVQEGRDTAAAIRKACPQAQINLIGPLQSNKINLALKVFDGIETVADLSLAQKLSQRLDSCQRTWPLLIQVNVSGEPSKSGVSPSAAVDLALAVSQLPALEVRGFMTVGLPGSDEAAVRLGYQKLREIRDRAQSLGLESARELSMGMSADLEWAIAEGATIVRVGTAAFGPRPA